MLRRLLELETINYGSPMKLSIYSVISLFLFLFTGSVSAMQNEADQKNREIAACNDCAMQCERCIASCLKEGSTDCIASCRDCADVCSLSAKLTARGSQFAEDFCALCPKVCAACVEACAKNDQDEECKRCVEACNRCIEACSKDNNSQK